MGHEYRDPQGRPVNQFGTPIGPPVTPAASPPPASSPVSPVALPLPQPAYPASAAAYPPPQYSGSPYPPAYAPPPRAGMSTGSKVAIALGGGVAGVVVLGILAAIAIPVFLNQRARADAEHISVSLPATVAGYPRLTGAADSSVQNLVTGLPNEASAQGAVYGVNRPYVVVLAGHHVMLPKDRSGFLTGVAHSEQSSGVVQTAVDPGPLGGQMRCGSAADGSRTDCAFVDAGAFGVIDVATVGPGAITLAQQIRSQVEQRR